jgi:tetratricopeptide (TPR) repeat protein
VERFVKSGSTLIADRVRLAGRHWASLACLCLAAWGATAWAAAAAPAPSTAAPTEAAAPPTIDFTLETLVRCLGAERFEARERATALLQRFSKIALPLIEAAARDGSDPEIQWRARRILDNLAHSIEADWPADAAEIVRNYDALAPAVRGDALRKLAQILGPRAAPFLVQRLDDTNPAESEAAADLLAHMEGPEVSRIIITSLPDPKSPHQVNAVVAAMDRDGPLLESLRFLPAGPAATPAGATHDAVWQLRDRLILGAFDEVQRRAAELARQAPQDPRPAYLEAEALAAAGHAAEAKARRKQAAALSPNNKAAHAAAAELLESLGCRILAAAEWETVLRIQPPVAAYDLQAHVRLGILCKACELGEKGVAHFKAAVDLYESAGVASAVRVEGGSVAGLRLGASRYAPNIAGAALTDDPAAREMTAIVVVGIGDDRLEACRKAITASAARLRIRVDPPDLGLFDEIPTALRYDPKLHQVAMTLEETPCGKPAALDLGKGSAEVSLAVETPAAWVIFGVSPATGQARIIERFPRVYKVLFTTGPTLKGMVDATVTVNDRPCRWADMESGLPFATLPPEFRVVVTSSPAEGRHRTSYLQPPVAEVRDLTAPR